MRLSLKYYDQNGAFGALLPRTGTIERFVGSANVSDWTLFRLDDPIAYENASYQELLLRSRWQGHPIGGEEPTSVFIVLVPDSAAIGEDVTIDPKHHVAWGIARMIGG